MALDGIFVTLLKISEELTDEQFKEIKFLIQKHVPTGKLEQFKKPFELFNFLIKDGSITEHDCSVIRQALNNVHRLDLVDRFFEGDKLRLNNEPPCAGALLYQGFDVFENPAPSDPLAGQTGSPSRDVPLASSVSQASLSLGDVSSHRLQFDYDESDETEIKRIVDTRETSTASEEFRSDGATVRSDGAVVRSDRGVDWVHPPTPAIDVRLELSVELSSLKVDGASSESSSSNRSSAGPDVSLLRRSSNRIAAPPGVFDEEVFRQLPTLGIDHDRILNQLRLNTNLRNYQKLLAEPGLRGENSIVVLQTGGGKTHVAGYITKYHSVKAALEGKKFLCLFLVPIRHLAEQQLRVYDDAFQSLSSHNLGTGIAKDTDEFMDNVRKNEVVFCTAQIFANALRIKDYNFNLRNVSIIIMDECHHTSGGHPNNKVMEQYLLKKFDNEEEVNDDIYRPNNQRLPQIVGLSASLGAGDKSKSDERKALATEALNQLSLMCYNLDASRVVFPRSAAEREDLRDHCPDPGVEEIVRVGKRFDALFDNLLRGFVEDAMSFLDDPIDIRNLKLGEHETLLTIGGMVEKETENPDQNKHIAARYLMEFSKAFSLLKILRCRDVVEFLKVNEKLPFHAMDEKSSVEYINRVKDLWRQNVGKFESFSQSIDEKPTPILAKLKEKLLELFREPDTRGILLVERRFTTKAIMDFIESDVELSEVLNPVRLVGKTEMSDHEVTTHLDRFRSGDANLLVATNIAQEGIDIPQCNVVIRYHYVSDEIGATQAVGRARREGSQCYLFVISGSPEEQRELRNQNLIKAMNDALSLFAEKTSGPKFSDWTLSMEKRQRKAYVTKRKKREEKKKRLEKAADYDIVCAHCKEPICPAVEVVKINETNHHLLVGDDFEKKIYRKEFDDLSDDDHGGEVDRIARVFCNSCKDNKIGVEITFKKGLLYRGPQISIKASAVKYFDRRSKRSLPRTRFMWKHAPFKVKTESYKCQLYDDFDSDEDGDDIF